ncbi:MAG: hypothetical protein ACOCXZ_02765 [Chloroflexota bacterium]
MPSGSTRLPDAAGSRVGLVFTYLLLLLLLTFFVFVATQNFAYPGSRSAEDRALMEAGLGLDDPVIIQYGRWLGDVFSGDLGHLLGFNQPVTQVIREPLGASLELLIFGVMVGAVLIVAAGPLLRSRWLRSLIYAVPVFWAALLLLLVFGETLELLPVGGRFAPFRGGESPDLTNRLEYLVMPSLTLGFYLLGRALWWFPTPGADQAVPAQTIRWVARTLLREAGGLVSVLLVVETIFSWPGLLQSMFASISTYGDGPLMRGALLVILAGTLAVTLGLRYLMRHPAAEDRPSPRASPRKATAALAGDAVTYLRERINPPQGQLVYSNAAVLAQLRGEGLAAGRLQTGGAGLAGRPLITSRQHERLRRLSGTQVLLLGAIILYIVLIGPLLIDLLNLTPYRVLSPRMAFMDIGATVDGQTFLLGTDEAGRDVLGRLIEGGRYSLLLALLAGGLGTILGVLLGTWASKPGVLLRRYLRLVLYSAPLLILAILVLFSRRFDGYTEWLIAVISVVVALEATMLWAANPLNLREPEGQAQALALFLAGSATALLLESTLSFLGFGVPPPEPTWGNMLNSAQNYIRITAHQIIFPGLMITISAYVLYFVSDPWLRVLKDRVSDHDYDIV